MCKNCSYPFFSILWTEKLLGYFVLDLEVKSCFLRENLLNNKRSKLIPRNAFCKHHFHKGLFSNCLPPFTFMWQLCSCGKGHAMMKKHSDLYKETIISQNSMINELIKSFNWVALLPLQSHILITPRSISRSLRYQFPPAQLIGLHEEAELCRPDRLKGLQYFSS